MQEPKAHRDAKKTFEAVRSWTAKLRCSCEISSRSVNGISAEFEKAIDYTYIWKGDCGSRARESEVVNRFGKVIVVQEHVKAKQLLSIALHLA